jgi:protein-tyrosine phosphatase
VRRTWRRYWPVLPVVVIACAAIVASVLADRYYREHFPKNNFSLIEDGLYLGGSVSEPPAGTQAVLNVGESEDPYRVAYHEWHPIPDAAPAPSLDWLRQRVEFIDQQRRAGRQVYVHCRAGVSRSGMVLAAYLMYRDGSSRDEALAVLREKRPRVRPNPAFMPLLLEWEESLKRSKK